MRTKYILIADDNSSILQSIKDVIDNVAKQAGHDIKIFAVSNGSDAIEKYMLYPIDLIFVDYHFEGGISGDQIIGMIDDPFQQTMFVLMSSKNMDELETIIDRHHNDLGMRFRFLEKEFKERQLKATYREVMIALEQRPLPFPLAYAKHNMLVQQQAHAQLAAIYEAINSILSFLTIIMLSDAKRLKIQDITPLEFSNPESLSIQKWFSWSQSLIDKFRIFEEDLFVPEILSFFTENEKIITDLINDNGESNNQVRENIWFERKYQEKLPLIQQLHQDIRFMARYALLSPIDMNFTETDKDDFIYKVRLQMGSSDAFRIAHFRNPARMRTLQMYLYKRGELLSLHPFMLFEFCDSCEHQRLYTMHEVSADDVTYIASCSHKITRPLDEVFSQSISFSVQEKDIMSTDAGFQQEMLRFLMGVGTFAMSHLKVIWAARREEKSVILNDTTSLANDGGGIVEDITKHLSKKDIENTMRYIEKAKEAIIKAKENMLYLQDDFSEGRKDNIELNRSKEKLEKQIDENRREILIQLKSLGMTIEEKDL